MGAAEDQARRANGTPSTVEDTMRALARAGPAVAALRRAYEGLHAQLATRHDAAESAQLRIGELTAEVAACRAKTVALQRAEAEAASRRGRLRSSTASLDARREEARRTAARRQEEVAAMDRRRAHLERAVEEGPGWTDAQRAARAEQEHQMEELRVEAAERRKLALALRSEVGHVAEAVERLQARLDSARTDIGDGRRALADAKERSRAEQGRRADLEGRLQELQAAVGRARVALSGKRQALQAEAKAASSLEERLRQSKQQTETYLSEREQLLRSAEARRADLERQEARNAALAAEIKAKEDRAAVTSREAATMKRRAEKARRMGEDVAAEINARDREKEALEARRDELRNAIAYSSRSDLMAERRKGEHLARQAEQAKREQQVLARKAALAAKASSTLRDLAIVSRNSRKALGSEAELAKAGVRRLAGQVRRLSAERAGFEQDAAVHRGQLRENVEELKLQEAQIAELHGEIIEGQARVKRQQSMYEAVRGERDAEGKRLLEAQSEIASMEQEFKVLSYEIDLIRDEVTAKDHALVKEHFNHHSVDKEKEALRAELSKTKRRTLSCEQVVVGQRAEVLALSQVIDEATAERQHAQKERDAVAAERYLLNTQLTRRNEELAALYERHSAQRSALSQGRAAHEKFVREIARLASAIAALRTERSGFRGGRESEAEVKTRITATERELLRERAKIKALSTEMGKPLNVHRWQALKHTDPRRWEMIRKVRKLERRLLSTTAEVADKQRRLQEKERLCAELKTILARRPGPGMAEQLALYEGNLGNKRKQHRAMLRELELHKRQVEELQADVVTSEAEARALKRRYIRRQCGTDADTRGEGSAFSSGSSSGSGSGSGGPAADPDTAPKASPGAASSSSAS